MSDSDLLISYSDNAKTSYSTLGFFVAEINTEFTKVNH